MNPVTNPYSPGAGTQPPELAGRDEVREDVRVVIERTRIGRSAKSVLMIGLRGVGKTVLLDRMRDDAETLGIHTLRIEAPENRSLPALLAPELRLALLRLSRIDKAKDLAKRALRALAGFATGLKMTYSDIEVGFDYDPEPGLADNGDLEHDLQALFEVIGEAAKRAETALVLFADELQYVRESELEALITALHRINQKHLPIALIGAGLPQLRANIGNAKSYAERLFEFPEIGPLAPGAAKLAITKPAFDENVVFDDEAVNIIINQTQGYPYFLQEWGKHAWDAASQSPITLHDVHRASISAIAALDESFFRVRFDRLSQSERRYLRAMADLGPGPHRSGDIADVLGKNVTAFGPTRKQLISKGMVWSPNHGETAFTVPLFDEFMKRIMPGDAWNSQ